MANLAIIWDRNEPPLILFLVITYVMSPENAFLIRKRSIVRFYVRPQVMTSFPDKCWCKNKEQLNNVLHDFGDGWEGWVQYIRAWGEVSKDLVENAPCYVEWCIEQAKKFQNLHADQSFTFNGDCKRCKAAMNVIIYPPELK